MRLTDLQVSRFSRNGYLVVRQLLDDQDLWPLINNLQEFIEGRAVQLQQDGIIGDVYRELPFQTRYARLFEQAPQISQGIYQMEMRSRPIFDFLHNPTLLDAVESLIGPEITSSPIQHIRAKVPSRMTGEGPDTHQSVPWHQDAAVMGEEADAAPIVTCWVPLVDATYERGCLQVMPRAHLNGCLEHRALSEASLELARVPAGQPKIVKLKKGDVLFMGQFTPHCSTPNRTAGDVRWSIDVRYQITGTPTGRPYLPEFAVRSRSDPKRVLDDYERWRSLWEHARAAVATRPQNSHRV